MTTPHPTRRPRTFLQFSLRALLVFVLLVSIGMSWLGVEMERARKRKEAVEAIERMGGHVVYGYEYGKPSAEPSTPRWLREVFGDDFFLDVWSVDVGMVGDFGDDEAGHLKPLTDLKFLNLCGTQTTDVGLEHLEGLTSLGCVHLYLSQVTPEGVKKLQGALPECSIYYEGTTIAYGE